MRRLFMWLAVASLAGLALASAATSAAALSASASGAGGWTFYTPYGGPPPTVAMRVLDAGSSAQTLLLPLAALSSAAYILLLDRDVRRASAARGFDVEPRGRGGGSDRGRSDG